MFSNILEDAMFEMRHRWKARVFVPLGIIAVAMIVGILLTTVTWLMANRAQPPSVNSKDIPLDSYTAGNIEVFDCIYRGPKECSEYARSKEWVSNAVAGDLIYTPAKGDEDAPGKKSDDGTRRVTDFHSLTDDQWHALSAGVTNSGAANPGTVTENSVNTSSFAPEDVSASATFSLTDTNTPITGTMTFTLSNSGIALKSVTYTEGG